jgi:GAF domain-containing protein
MTLDRVAEKYSPPPPTCTELTAPLATLRSFISSARDGIEVVDFASLMVVTEGDLRILEGDVDVREVERLQCALKDGPAFEAFRTGRVCRVVSVASSRQWPAVRELCRRCGVRSMAAVPVKRDGVLVGTLNLYSRDYHAIGPVETRAALQIAQQAGDLIR